MELSLGIKAWGWALLLGLGASSAGCGGDSLPAFADPPPLDAGDSDASDDDASTGD